MPGRGRDDYTLERMLERRYRNNIRKVLERNGRRLTAREIDIVNLCTRYPDQRYTLFTYYCDANCMRLNPYVLPQLPVPDHHHHHCQQRQTVGSSDSDRSGSTSVVAPLLLQLNMGADDANARTEGQSESGHPSTSRVTLPCYLLTDRPEASASSGIELNSTVNLIADTIIESLKCSSDKGNSDNGNDERQSSDKANSKKSSRKNSKKKKKHRKKGRAKSRISETQTRSHYNPSDEPCISSDSSSSSHAEISLVDGDGGDQRVKSDTETVLQCFSSNSSDRCHADVSCSNSMLSSDEGEATVLALPGTVGPAEDAANEDPNALEQKDKADGAQCSSDAWISNDFIPVVSGRRGRYGRRVGQQCGNPSRFAAFSGCSGDRFSTWQEKPSKIVSEDMRTESLAHESSNRTETSKLDSNLGPTKLPAYLRKDRNISGSVDRHSGEYIFQKDDFPSLPLPSSGLKEVVRCKVGPRPPQRDNSKKPPVPLPRKSPECKESESEAVGDTKLSIPILEVKISEVEESGSGSGSSSGAFFSPDSSKSSQMNQSSHDTSGLDSPRSSKASDETQLRPDTCPSDTNDGHNASQSGHDISTSDVTGGKSTTDVAQAGHDTCPSNLSNTTSTDIDASRSGSSVCSSPASTTPISHSTSMPCLDIGELKNMPAVCSTNLEEILGAVWDAHRVYQTSELVQSAFGGPFADYELLCRYASPVVDLPPHRIADVPLQKIWQWYEEPSCYTLEVKGCQDHHRLVDFTAHFVPSLSAVQLFVRHGPSATFSKHLPKEGGSESAPGLEEVLGVGAESAELVFEFFEYEQPYFRQTLFEKVKELVGGLAQGMNLERLHIGDLHPASWFSVAWYPAYTVPEGRSSFKAAFLTYHSLAHFVQGAAGPSVDGRVAVSSFPVVGLMSYNTKESWYHERYHTGGEVMVERLEKLNLTAGVMARARVMRGSQVSGNHHPDFEFFASRQHCN